jgi:hypothetical protein
VARARHTLGQIQAKAPEIVARDGLSALTMRSLSDVAIAHDRPPMHRRRRGLAPGSARIRGALPRPHKAFRHHPTAGAMMLNPLQTSPPPAHQRAAVHTDLGGEGGQR